MPVGTRGAVKAVTQRDLEELGAEIILGNTYHLYLKPGDGLIARVGGLHRFIGWHRPILTDSGGYQIFSLARCGAITRRRGRVPVAPRRLAAPADAGDGADIQAQLGSDIAMVLDECIAHPGAGRTRRARRRWSGRCAGRAGRARAGSQLRDAAVDAGVIVTNPAQAQFGIIQGGIIPACGPRASRRPSRSASRRTRSAG